MEDGGGVGLDEDDGFFSVRMKSMELEWDMIGGFDSNLIEVNPKGNKAKFTHNTKQNVYTFKDVFI